MCLGHRFQVFQVDFGVVVDDHARVKQVAGVECRLDLPHQPVRVLPPLHFHERRHVPAGTVLSLQGTMVLLHDHGTDLLHERLVLADLLRLAEILGQHEMEVPVQGMPENDGIAIAMAVHDTSQIKGRLGKVLFGEGDIFDNDRGPDAPDVADRRKEPLANIPERLVLLFFPGKRNGEYLRYVGQQTLHLSDLLLQNLPAFSPDIHELGGGHHLPVEFHDGQTGSPDVRENHERR